MADVLEHVLHQLSTDVDLDERVTAPEKYDMLESMVREVLTAAVPAEAGRYLKR